MTIIIIVIVITIISNIITQKHYVGDHSINQAIDQATNQPMFVYISRGSAGWDRDMLGSPGRGGGAGGVG